MKPTTRLFNGLLLILLGAGLAAAQMPTSTRVPTDARMQSATEKPGRPPQLKLVAVRLDGVKLLGVRSLDEKSRLGRNEIRARAVTDGASILLGFETPISRRENAEITVESDIFLDEGTSNFLGSNIYSILDGRYRIETADDEEKNSSRPVHSFLRTVFRPNGEHRIGRSILQNKSIPVAEVVELEVQSLLSDRSFSKPVLVTIKDGNILNIKAPGRGAKPAGKDVFNARASFVNTTLRLEFDRPISRMQRLELKAVGSLIEDVETSEYLGGVCSCTEGSFEINAAARNPTVVIPVIAGKAHHRWLFHRTSYGDPTKCSYPAKGRH